MRLATATHVCVFVLFAGTMAGFVAADDDAWLVAPPPIQEVASADHEARDELTKAIAEGESKGSRDGWGVEIPERGSGVPAKYDLLLHRGSDSYSESRARLEIQVHDGRARWELCKLSGIYRAERPAADVDRLVRQFAYAFHAVQKPVREDTWSFFSSSSAAYDIEVISRDDESPFHLRPRNLQVDRNSLGSPTDRLRNHAFAVLVEHLFKVARRECQPISEKEESREILRRLKTALRLGERRLYGGMAVERGLKDALPVLKSLFLVGEEKRLQIAVADDPKPLVLQAIADGEKDPQLAAWAVRFAADDRHPERQAWLLEILARLEDDTPPSHYAAWILRALSDKKLTEEQLAQLAAQFAETKNQRLKIGVADVLLQQTHEEKYFSYLDSLVRSLPPNADAGSDGPRRAAARHLLNYAVQSGKRQAEARSLLKKLLAEPRKKDTPDSFEMFELIDFLGDLGLPEDVPYLVGLAQTGTPYLMSSATSALAKLDAQRALEVLHERMERWIERPANENSYSHEIFSHFALMIFENDTAASPLLKKAWERLTTREPPLGDLDESESIAECYDPAHVIAFLEATTGADRAEAAIAHFGDRAHYEDRSQMQRLVDRLIAEGADAERCKVLLQIPENARRVR